MEEMNSESRQSNDRETLSVSSKRYPQTNHHQWVGGDNW